MVQWEGVLPMIPPLDRRRRTCRVTGHVTRFPLSLHVRIHFRIALPAAEGTPQPAAQIIHMLRTYSLAEQNRRPWGECIEETTERALAVAAGWAARWVGQAGSRLVWVRNQSQQPEW